MVCAVSNEMERVVADFGRLVGEYMALLNKYRGKRWLYRVVSYKRVVPKVSYFQGKINTFMVTMHVCHMDAMADLRVEMHDATIASEVAHELDQVEVQHMLFYELQKETPTTADSDQCIVEIALNKVLRRSKNVVSSVPEWFLPEHKVEFKAKAFASGSFGTVYYGQMNLVDVVIKRLLVDTRDNKIIADRFRKEATLWFKFRHKHVLTMYGTCDVSSPPFIVCEHATHGNLFNYLSDDANRCFTFQLMRQAAVGLAYLHEDCVVHGDLKCGNILVVSDRTAKVADFSFSYVHILPTFASDVYALGMCIIEATSLELPWGYYVDDDSVRDLVKSGDLPEKPEQVADLVSELGDLAIEEAELHGQRSNAAPDSVSYDGSQWSIKSTQADRNPWGTPFVDIPNFQRLEPRDVATTSRQKYTVLFVGGPDSGKSTLLNCLMGEQIFESGISYDIGLTLDFQEYTRQAAAAITQALKAADNYRIFLTVRLQYQRAAMEDVMTIERVLNSITTPNLIYSVVFNKVEGEDYDTLVSGQPGFQPLALRDVLKSINSGRYATRNVFFLQKIRKLTRARNSITELPQGFRSFVSSAPLTAIHTQGVSAINTDAKIVQPAQPFRS